MRYLIGLTCVAVLAAIGWWGWQQYDAAQKAERKAARDARIEAAFRAEKCKRQMADWEAGRRDALIAEFGDYAEQVISTCPLAIAAAESLNRDGILRD